CYPAKLPDRQSMQIREDGQNQSLVGKYSGERDVFKAYYAGKVGGKKSDAPHFAFANCEPTDLGIKQFTAEWGTLVRVPVTRRSANPLTISGSEPDPSIDFIVPLNHWRQAQQFFRTMLD